ncbi:MAG: alpha/beta fold hydrolase [Litorilinea sp.]
MPLVQAMLTTRRPAGVEVMDRHTGALLVDGGADEWPGAQGATVKLLAYYTPASAHSTVNTTVTTTVSEPGHASRGLVILLHGWEGCSHAIFNLTLGSALVRAGYDVARLNLRDHGPTARIDPVYLNEGLFLGTLLGEVRRAVANLAALRPGGPVYLVGASLGGNYALRLASQAADGAHAGLDGVIAVSPVVDPARSIDLIDTNYAFRRFFRARWISTLQRKAAAFPQRYNFDGIERLSRIRPMTEWLVRRYTTFASADAYFGSYAYLDGASRALTTPTTLLAAVDDPVIPIEDINGLADSPWLTRRILGWGGHAGLIEWPPLRHRMPDLVLDILSGAA